MEAERVASGDDAVAGALKDNAEVEDDDTLNNDASLA